MKLLYLYIEEFRTFNEVELNFDSNIRFVYRKGKLSVEPHDSLNPDFFSLQKEARVVDSISAIVGNNGAGKTSVAALMNYIFVLGRPYPRYICVCEVNGKIICYSNLINSPEDSEPQAVFGDGWEFRTKNLYKDAEGCPFSVLYYTPHFHPKMIWENRNRWCHDISSVSNMNAAVGIATNDPSHNQDSPIEVLNRELNMSRIDFMSSYAAKANDNDMPFPLPASIEIKADLTLLVEFEGYVFDLQKRFGNNDESVRYLARLKHIISTKDSLRIVLIAFAIYVAKHFSYSEDKIVNCPEERDLIDLCLSNLTYVELKQALSSGAWKSALEKWAFVDAEKFSVFIREWINVFESNPSSPTMGHGIRIRLNNKEAGEAVKRLIAAHYNLTNGNGSFMAFDPSDMSAGECSFFNLFALLYRRLNSSQNSIAGPIMLFLDEVESTLHPGWQREMVYNVIWFLEHYAKDCKVHVIFSTHSPILLSDIPKENCVFLEKKDGVTKVVELCGQAGEDNTFGANIFDMYYHSFFMQDGTIGKFAMSKIYNLERLGTADQNRVVRLVGDPFVRGMLEDRFGCSTNTAVESTNHYHFKDPEIDYPRE